MLKLSLLNHCMMVQELSESSLNGIYNSENLLQKCEQKMSNISEKRNTFKVEIRKKRIEDKFAQLRSNFMQRNMKDSKEQYSEDKISSIVKETLTSKEKLIQNITLIKSASFYMNQKNAQLFFPLINDFCFVLGNLQEMKQTQNMSNKDQLYNQLLITLINISSTETYQWPAGQYLPIIKNLLRKQRQINTMWLLSNILYQRNTPQTQKYLTQQLVKYDGIKFCEQRLNSKFDNEQDINVFSCFVCSFLSNSEYLTLDEFKRALKVIQSIAGLSLQAIDLNIFESMIDHAPHLGQKNYQLLYSDLISSFRQRYVKKKKTQLIRKFLEFFKIYIFTQLQNTINPIKQGEFKNQKLARKNYQRISLIVLPILTLCISNLSPQVKATLMEICSLLLEYYFPFIDLEHQQIYLSLAETLSKNTISTLSKYSNKAIIWQLRLVYTLLNKIQQYKIETQIIAQFIGENNVLEAFVYLLKQKNEVLQIIEGVSELLLLILNNVDKETLVKDKNSKNEFHLNNIKQSFETILDNNVVQDEVLHNKIESLTGLCEAKY